MTATERVERLNKQFKALGISPSTKISWGHLDPNSADELNINNIADMMETHLWAKTRPMKPFYDSGSKIKNFKTWVRHLWRCLIDPFRRWSWRRHVRIVLSQKGLL